MRKLILVALNEFNVGFFQHATEVADLPNIKNLLAMPHGSTWTDDAIERKGLDPWVQWVSIHTGTPFAEHGIQHLGDVPNLSTRQLWEKLSREGISSGIWGAMNATRNDSQLCRFFLPDPWTFSERAFPAELNNLLALPRYYSRNYLEVGKLELAKTLLKLVLFVVSKPFLMFQLLKIFPITLHGLLKFGLKNHVFFSVFDLVSTVAFLHYKASSDPDFSMIFLNSIAHIQHNIWCEQDTLDDKCLYALRAIDMVLGLISSSLGRDEALIVMNALNQRNIATEKHDILYRQISPARFLNEVGIRYRSVEQLMTNDGHILFDSVEDAIVARDLLEQSTINGRRIFDVEHSVQNLNKVFFQLEFWDVLAESAEFILGDKAFRFFDHFDFVVRRTGEHLQSGDVYASRISLPAKLYNHEVHQHILHYFGLSSSVVEETAVSRQGVKIDKHT